MTPKIRKALIVIVWRPYRGAEECKTLLLKVCPERGAFWQSATGKVEENETFIEGALREAQEETGFQFDHFPQFLALDYEFQGRWGPAQERAYLLNLYSELPPTPTLDPSEHTEFVWANLAEAISFVKFPNNRLAIERSMTPFPPLFLTKTGIFFHEGEEITHTRTKELFHKSLVNQNGSFQIISGMDHVPVWVEETPAFIQKYNPQNGMIHLLDGSEEPLNPKSIIIGKDNAFTCEIARGWRAVFLSPAYYEMTKSIESLDGKYILNFLGHSYELSITN